MPITEDKEPSENVTSSGSRQVTFVDKPFIQETKDSDVTQNDKCSNGHGTSYKTRSGRSVKPPNKFADENYTK